MSNPTPAVRGWARQLLAAEATKRSGADADGDEVIRVCESLRISLEQFVGADGFTVLLRRALALARTDVPSLQITKVSAAGRLEQIEKNFGNGGTDSETAITLVAHLLGLLVIFIGESLTLRLIRKALPDKPDRTNAEPEDFK